MHELSIALSLVEVASEAARKANVSRVDAVYLKLGVLSGVVKDALLFSYDIAAEGTVLAGSRLEIEELPVIVYCDTCDAERPVENSQMLRCPVCQTPALSIVQGQELEITSLEVPDAEIA